MGKVFIKNIPTREVNGEWVYTTFDSREDLRDFVKGIFKEPGKYEFDGTVQYFNEHARNFDATGLFCDAPRMSQDYINFWDTEREKCRKGVIFKGENGNVWYLPRFYYHWINFLQIGGKESGIFQFPSIWDTQYHLALYETLAELHYKNAVILKKRQIASSYLHACKMFNKYIFENSYVGKMLASSKAYINNTNGTWRMLNEYQNFNNKHTSWACVNSPNRPFEWQQKVETKTSDGRSVTIGTDAILVGITMDKDPVAGVGGRVSEVFYEEGGVAPTADQTYRYMLPAIKQGSIITGQFIIAGSVGALDQCLPLKNFLLNPDGNDFYGVESNLRNRQGKVEKMGLFIPEQWSYPPYIDKYGNSLVKEALEYLNNFYQEEKKIKSPEEYQILVSQGPRDVEEAFAMRTVSVFPLQYTSAQVQRIEDNEYAIEYVDLERDQFNKIKTIPSERRPINKFPFDMKEEDKKSIVCIHEPPAKNAKLGDYIAAIDPVETGRTHTSPSLASIVIYKMDVQVIDEEIFKKNPKDKEAEYFESQWGSNRPIRKKKDEDIEVKVTSHLEGGKIVAFWCGRFDDINQTNEYMSMLVELYNAKVVSEANKPSFIQYMVSKKRQKYLVTRDEIVFDKDLRVVQNTSTPYGIIMSAKIWKILLEESIASLSEVLWEEKDEDGEVTRIHYGVERITDIMILKEMQAYQPGDNADRLISYGILMEYIKILQATGRVKKRVQSNDIEASNARKVEAYKDQDTNLFKSIGMKKSNSPFSNFKLGRSPFRNIK